MKLFFVVPAYNEEANLGPLLERLAGRLAAQGRPHQVLVVDDGSTDGTAAIARAAAGRLPVRLIRHARNEGPGGAFDTGLRAALAEATDDDLVITQEADNTSDPGILGELVRRVAEGEADVALASCYAPGGGVEGTSPSRRLLSAVANGMLRVAFPLGIHTYSSFYRVYRAGILREAYRRYPDRLITEAGFVCMVELLIKLGRMEARLAEVPMVLRCQARQDASKMRVVRTIRGYLRLIVRFRLLGGLPRPLDALPEGDPAPLQPAPGVGVA